MASMAFVPIGGGHIALALSTLFIGYSCLKKHPFPRSKRISQYGRKLKPFPEPYVGCVKHSGTNENDGFGLAVALDGMCADVIIAWLSQRATSG